MSALGSLVVKLGLDYAQYTGGLDKSEQAALAASKKIQDTFDGMKAKVAATAGAIAGGLAAGFTIAAFKSIISGSIETGAALDDLRMQTGATVESLSALAAIGKFNNMSAEQIGGAMNKLSANLAGATEESKGAGKAVEALGIDFEKFRQMRPEEQMQTVAKAMAEFEDGTGKSAVAMALYGKEGAKMLPFLNDLASVGELQAKVTTEQAAAAANLDDNLTRLSTSGEGWKKELANGMIPALDLGAQALVDMLNGTGGLRDEVKKLSADGSIKEWTTNAIKGLSYVADAGQIALRVLQSIGKGFGGLAAALVQALQGDFSAAWSTLQETGQDMIETFDGPTVGSRFRDSLDKITASAAAAGDAIEKPKKSLNDFSNTTAKAGKTAAEAKDPFDALRDSIVKSTAAYQAEATAGEKLTEGQKKAIDVLDQIRTGKVKVTEAQAIQIGKDIEAMLAAEGENKAREEFIKIADAERAARVKIAQTLEQAAVSLDASNQAMREEIELIGLTDQQQVRVLQQRNDAIILTKEATLAELERASAITGTMTREQIALQAEIEALRERNQLLGAKYDKTVVAKAAEQASGEWTKFTDSVYNGLSDSLYRGFEVGKGFFKSFWDGIKNTAKTTVLKFAVQGVMTGVSGALGFGQAANAATGGTNALSMASNGFSLYNAGSQAYTLGAQYLGGTMSGANVVGTTVANATGTGLDGLLMTNGAYGTAGPGAAAGSGAYAAGGAFVAVAALVLNALGAFKSDKQTGSGFQGTLGGTVSPYEEWREGGSLFSGPSSSKFNPLQNLIDQRAELQGLRDQGLGTSGGAITLQANIDSIEKKYGDLITSAAAQNKIIQDSYDGMRKSAGDMADALGLSSESVRKFTIDLTGDREIELQGLTPEAQQAKFAQALATANNELAEQVLGSWVTTTQDITRVLTEGRDSDSETLKIWEETNAVTSTRYVASEYAKAGEKAIDTLTRLAGSLGTVNTIWENLGYTVYEASLAGANSASTMADAFGGLDNMASVTGTYYDLMYSDAEKRANTARQISEALGKVELSLPNIDATDAQAQWRALAEAQDRSTEEGRNAYVTILQLTSAFVGITSESAAAADAVSDAMRRLQSDTTSLEVQLLRAKGDTTGADAAQYTIDTAGLTAAEIAVFDYNASLRAQISALDAATAAAQQQADIREGFERQLLELTGDTAALRLLDIQGMDAANVALYDNVQAITSLRDAASDNAAEMAALDSFRASLAGTIESARMSTMNDAGKVDYLQGKERGLWSQLDSAADPAAVAAQLQQTILDRIGIEARMRGELDSTTLAGLQQQLTVAQSMRSAAEGMQRTVDGLRLGSSSALSSYDQLQYAGGKFDAAYQRALAGDVNAFGDVQSYGQSYVQLGRDNYASSTDSADIFFKVTDAMDQLAAMGMGADPQITALNTQIDLLGKVGSNSDQQVWVAEQQVVQLSALDDRLGRVQERQAQASEKQLALAQQQIDELRKNNALLQAQIEQTAAAVRLQQTEQQKTNAELAALKDSARMAEAATA